MSIAENPIFISGSPRSGTTLMTALLDGHPDLTVFPEEYLYCEPQHDLNLQNLPVLKAMFKEKVLLRLQGKDSFLDGMHEEGRDYNGFDYNGFENEVDEHFQRLFNRESVTCTSYVPALALIALLSGFSRVTGIDQQVRGVIKNPRYELYWQQIIKDFPNAKIIYMIRNPHDVILSRTIKKNKREHLRRGGSPSNWKKKSIAIKPSATFLRDWERSIMAYRSAKSATPSQILRVRYEDLVSSPQNVMHEVAEFLGITWFENLLAPSFFGKPWKGGSMHGHSFNKINKSKQVKLYELLPHQLWQIDAWLGNLIVEEPGGYALSEHLGKIDGKALLSCLKEEGVVAFVLNRARMISNHRNYASALSDTNKLDQ